VSGTLLVAVYAAIVSTAALFWSNSVRVCSPQDAVWERELRRWQERRPR